jgi:hypothetical protein
LLNQKELLQGTDGLPDLESWHQGESKIIVKSTDQARNVPYYSLSAYNISRVNKRYECRIISYRTDVQGKTDRSVFCKDPANGFNFKRVTHWRTRSMTLKIKSLIRVKITSAFVSPPDGSFLSIRVRVGDATSAAISGSSQWRLKVHSDTCFCTYALMAVPLMMARIGSLSMIACFNGLIYKAPIPSALA